jgi:hypothetical protein
MLDGAEQYANPQEDRQQSENEEAGAMYVFRNQLRGIARQVSVENHDGSTAEDESLAKVEVIHIAPDRTCDA